MMNVRLAITILSVIQIFATTVMAGDPRPALNDLAFLEGRWIGSDEGDQIEEIWSAPRDGSVIGMYRVTKDGRTTFYELLVVQQLERGPVLRLKHFNEALVGWEEKDKSVELPLVRVSKNEAVFESGDNERLTRLTYRRESATSLVATLEKKRDGKTQVSEYRFSAAK